MKYQVLFEHPCLQMKRYFCSTLMLSAWWENRTDQPGAQYHFIITDRLFLWCNAPISLSFFVSLCRKYCVLTAKVSHPLKHQLFSFSFVCLPPYPLTVNTCLTEVMQTIHILRPIFPTLQPLQGFCSSLCRFR